MTSEKFIEMANEMRKEGFNFVFVVERDGKIYSQSSVTWESNLKEIEKEAMKISRAGKYVFLDKEKLQ
ncbi:MAG: hypothetical protein MJ126_09890 [Lachnospiraceae bacterium]|nr:hypothetical protein [Lachnospiraceae bacterium]